MTQASLTISGDRVIRNGKFTGYTLSRGSFISTPDDRLDRWYFEHEDATMVDRRGSGYATKLLAVEALEDRLRNA